MIKLSRRLFHFTGDSRYMDYVERALVNQILGSRADADSPDDPLVTYMLPVAPGSRRQFGNLGTCCGGTGLESLTKLQEAIFDASPSRRCALRQPVRALPARLVRAWDHDHPGGGRPGWVRSVDHRRRRRFSVTLRVPHWAASGFAVRINGSRSDRSGRRGGYVSIHRDWVDGDTIDVVLPAQLRVERALDDAALVTIFDGPIALAARDGSVEQLRLGDLDAAPTPRPTASLPTRFASARAAVRGRRRALPPVPARGCVERRDRAAAGARDTYMREPRTLSSPCSTGRPPPAPRPGWPGRRSPRRRWTCTAAPRGCG